MYTEHERGQFGKHKLLLRYYRKHSKNRVEISKCFACYGLLNVVESTSARVNFKSNYIYLNARRILSVNSIKWGAKPPRFVLVCNLVHRFYI